MDDDSNMARCSIFTLADRPSRTRKHVPKELKLDLFEQNAWLSAVLLKFIDIDYAFYHLFLG